MNNKPDKRLYFLINRAQLKLSRHVDKRAEAELGISSVQMGALFFVGKNDGCLLKDLSAGLDLQNSAITGLVGRMEKADLLERRACVEDARATRLYLTEKSLAILQKSKPLLAEMNRELTKGFTKDEMTVVARYLTNLVERF